MPSCLSCLTPRGARQRSTKSDSSDQENGSQSKILRRPHPPFNFPPPNASLGDYILKKLSTMPDFVAQVDSTTEREDTYGQMKDRSIRTALWLRNHGISPGDVVVVCSHNHCDSVIPVYAALYCAATMMPWDPILNTKDLKYLISLCPPTFIFCDMESVCTIRVVLRESKCNAKVIVFGEHHDCISYEKEVLKTELTKDFKCTQFDDVEQVAVIVCSSGSVGMPKAVEHTHRNLLVQLSVVSYLNIDRKTTMVLSSLYWISGTVATFVSLACNLKCIIVPTFEEQTACKLVEKYSVNWILMGTSVLLRLIHSGYLEKYDMSSVEKISAAGGVVSSEAFGLLKKAMPRVQIILGYGMTELCGVATIQDPTSKPGSCGKLIIGIALKVIDLERGEILGPGEIGELCWQSPCIMKGYRNNPEETLNAIDSENWLHSGDIGYYDSDGDIFIVDRLREMIKYRGNQIAPAEIENIIRRHPGVKDCVVVGKPHKVDGEHPVAFIVRREGIQVTEKEIIDLVAAEVIERKQLRGGVRFLDEFPLTPTGKPKRLALREILRNENK
ncbi:luciferin 4-monooxygenase [Cephus cinctus]|uniref:Luciferin 4-monooxygenase n=1 Tax=Cephus cinctus TaxID=211228 RepID=A0AAJ7FH69_CEPCN|nr:luciferin 4-monooxygenase [Cephus cinctus]